MPLRKGQRQPLQDGDVISLTKPAEDGIASGPRVQSLGTDDGWMIFLRGFLVFLDNFIEL